LKTITIGKNDAGQRLDRFIQKAFPSLPAATVQKAIRKKRIKVNGKRSRGDYRLSEEDVISVYLGDDLLAAPPDEEAFLRISNPDLRIIYEDENLLLLDKPAGLLCHSDDRETVNTLISHVRAYLYQKGEYRPEEENTFAPSLCNRIDRNTGGIVIAAKNSETLRIINEKIRGREIDKFYLCLVHGTPEPPSGVLEGFILRDDKKKQVSVFRVPRPGAKTARTAYRTLASKAGLSLVECRLITGRTHQIRAQMADAGHPLVGDGKYGVLAESKALIKGSEAVSNMKRQALYSYKLTFSFRTDAGILNYLRGRTFEIESVPFSL
jgi:23S rRNA pseudouridine955/2504/2580 synthase